MCRECSYKFLLDISIDPKTIGMNSMMCYFQHENY